MKGSITNRINDLIDRALARSPDVEDEQIIADVMNDPEIVWDIAKIEISKRVRERRAPKSAMHPYQMYFKGYGFKDFSQRVTIKVGGTQISKPLRTMTVTDFRDYVRSLEISAENTPKIAAARKLLEEMTPYARKQRNLTFEAYCDLLAAGTPPPKIGLSAQERSERIREQWARLTPAERRAIHEKRLKTRAERAGAGE